MSGGTHARGFRRRPLRVGAMLPLVAGSLLAGATGHEAAAQSCGFSITDVDFGNVDMTSGAPTSTTATIKVFCWGKPGQTVILCPNINAGSGGVATGGDPRYMRQGSSRIGYNLLWPSGNRVWGSYHWGQPPRPPVFGITLSSGWWFGFASGTITMRARLPGGQTTSPAGLYTSTFSTSAVRFDYRYYKPGVWCGNMLGARTARPTFSVRANIVPNCLVRATDIDFGTTGVLSGNVDAAGSITVRCNVGVTYRIALDGGTSGASDPTNRRMRNGSHAVRYGIYRDAARMQPWGNVAGSNTVAATATGSDQTFTTYGRVPPQPTPPAGTYTDTVVVTVTY